MARRRSAPPRWLGTVRSVVLLVALVVTVLVACTGEQSEPPDHDHPADAALHVTTLSESHLDEDSKARLESEVSKVLADYVAQGFLGEHPRSDYVQAFADFTSGAAEQAVADIEVLTASRFSRAPAVRATALGAELSFFVVDDEAVGATAWLQFSFDVDDEGVTTTATLQGTLNLERRNDVWSVFAYDVRRYDSDALPTEATSL